MSDAFWEPLPKQAVALTCTARELLYGGEKGGGKTEFLVACWLPLLELATRKYEQTGQKQHKCRIVVFRKNLEHLKDFIAKSQYIYPRFDPKMGVAGWHVNNKTWTFTSGATLECRHLDGPTDHLGYHGQELIGIGFDQVEQIDRDVYTFIVANNRSGDPDYHAARMIRCTANPGGYDWIIPYFGIDKYPDGNRIIPIQVVNSDGSKHETTRAFIRARLRENKHLPADYEAQLRSMYNEDEVAMFLEGDFFRVAGSYFSKFLRPQFHFKKSHPVPASWDFRFAIDWGSTNPACFLVGAVDNDGRLHVIDELHKPGVTGRKFGEDLTAKFRGQKWSSEKLFKVDDFWGVIDKQAMDKYGSEETAAAGIMEWGFRLFPAKKDRVAGCNQLKERLLLDRHGLPQMVIFEDRCPNLVKALSAIQSQAPKDPDDYADDSPYSHAVDALRFLCMEFPVHTVRETSPIDAEVARWNALLQKQRDHATDTPGTMSGGYGDA